MQEWTQAGKAAIQEIAPAGQDPRYEPEYAALQEELRKLTAITGGLVDWNTVCTQAFLVLTTKGKDFPAAAYLAYALGQTQGLQGWTQGLNILVDMLTLWWEKGFPPVKRIKGRYNALQWWEERSLQLLETWRDAAPFAPELLAETRTVLHALDSLCSERMEDMPPLRELFTALDRLPLAAAKPSPAAASPAEEEPAKAVQTEPTAPQQSQSPQAAATTAAPKAQSTAPSPSPAASGAQAPQAPSVETNADAPAYVQALQAFSDNISSFILSAEVVPTQAVLWQCVFNSLFGRIHIVPPHEEKRTAIPAPDTALLAQVKQLIQANNARGALQRGMGFLPQSPLWFSLTFQMYTALHSMGSSYTAAAQAVQQCAVFTTQRLKGIEELCYDDATPFADAAAKAWLVITQQTEQPQEEDYAAQAESLWNEGKQGQALALLTKAMHTVGKERAFELQLQQIIFLRRAEQWPLAEALLEKLLEQASSLHLEEWNAPLACTLWEAAWQLWSNAAVNKQEKAAQALHNIVLISPQKALSLVQG
jgi:type VI secretion system protein VasJ